MSTRLDNPPDTITTPTGNVTADYESTFFRGYLGDLFYRYILMDMPLDGHVPGVGDVRYHEKDIPLKRSNKDHPDPGDYALIEQMIGDFQESADWTALLLDALEFASKDIDVEALSRASGLNGNVGLGTKASLNATKLAQSGGKMSTRLGVVSLTITGRDMWKNGMNEDNTTDMVFGVVGFIPGVGWVISGVYTVANAVVVHTTGKSIPKHAKEKSNKLQYKLEMNVQAWFYNKMYNIFSWY